MACLWQTRGPINHAMGTVDELDVAGIKESATMESLQPVIGLIDYTMGDVNSKDSIFGSQSMGIQNIM